MSTPLSAEDLELDARWRERFGEPLPILGAHLLVAGILDSLDADGSGPKVATPVSNVVCLASRRTGRRRTFLVRA